MYRSIKKLGNKPWLYIPLSYLSRFLRLAPMMMFATMIQMTLLDQMGYGYHSLPRDYAYNSCKDQWYKILFFYANLTMTRTNNEEQQCMGQLWYIQCDMQMFLLLPILLWVFTKKKMMGIFMTMIPVVICVGIRLYYGFYFHFSANTVAAPYPAEHGSEQGSDSYFKPWTRMSVYFLAVALAMVMIVIDENKQRKLVLKAWQYWLCMISASFILLSLVVWPYQDVQHLPNDRWGYTANSLYYALGRTAWGFALCLMTFAWKYMNEDTENNGNGQKSMVKAFLSLEIWQPLGKLTYVMYLIHYTLIFPWCIGDGDLPTYYSEWNELFLVIGVWTIVASIGFVLWIVMERPLSNLVTVFLQCIAGGGKRNGTKK